MKKTVDPITKKLKIECLHFGVAAVCNSTKLAYHAAKKRGGDTRACVVEYSEY